MIKNKILVICGPTSTGKTSLALKIAKKFDGEIISADSRQVYKGMDIGTGKDIPPGTPMNRLGYYEIDGVKVWGYDLAKPTDEFSVSHFISLTRDLVDDIASRGKLPMVVGGTGLYIKGLVDGIETAGIPRNEGLRKNLESKSVEELYESLSQMDPIKAGSLNTSDKKNPRRLIRAVEVAQYYLSNAHNVLQAVKNEQHDLLFVGLTAPIEFIEEKIEKRVRERVDEGIKDEVKKLLDQGVGWENQSMLAIGYGGWRDYFEGGVTESEVINEWILDEKRYAKRQMTWFKKDSRIIWFDITDKDFFEKVENTVKKWYI